MTPSMTSAARGDAEDGEEKKHEASASASAAEHGALASRSSDSADASGIGAPRSMDEVGSGGGAETPRSLRSSASETASFDDADPAGDAAAADDGGDVAANGDNGDANRTEEAQRRKKWSEVLSTPSDSHALCTPTSDASSQRSNLHGLGLRRCVDRSKVVSRAGKSCSTFFADAAAVHDDLHSALGKLCPAALESATSGTPLEGLARDVARCASSYVVAVGSTGHRARDGVSKPYGERASKLAEECAARYSGYAAGRARCLQARRDAIRMRRRYGDSVREVDAAIAALRAKSRASKSSNNGGGGGAGGAGGARRRVATDSSNDSGDTSCAGGASGGNGSGGDGRESPPAPQSTLSWEEELRAFGRRNGVSRQCEAVVRASEDVRAAEAGYSASVSAENEAVDAVQDLERGALDEVQRLEEERILLLVGLLDRFLRDEREALDSVSVDLAPAEPLDLADDGGSRREAPSAPASSPTSLFMTPRRRAQSDDGPAINETRALGLPDSIADIRDSMKGLIGRQLGRLRALKSIAAFNEGIASAIEGFASSLKSLLEGGSNAALVKMSKNEGANVLAAWNAAIATLEARAEDAAALAREIRRGNSELQQLLTSAEKDTRLVQEREEYRWKSLCDAARVEAKAKAKHRQCVADLEKAQSRLTESEGGAGGDEGGSEGAGNTSPKKSTQMNKAIAAIQATHNKNLGKMFSILPGGGEDVMNKVLNPQQRQAIAERQLDEANAKEEKATESFEVARSVKQQAVVSYQTEAEATEFKFKADERREWDSMQQSLVCLVKAIKAFLETQLSSVSTSIDVIKERLQDGRVLEDVDQWAAFTEQRVRDQLGRTVDDAREDGDQSPESGFRLKVHLLECTNIEETARQIVDEEDDVIEDVQTAAEDAGPELSPSPATEVNGGNDETTTAPQPDVPPDPFIGKMDPIFSKKLKNVSIEEYYSAGWSEETPLYGPWLERKGSMDVSVSDWEYSSSGGFENAWSKEKFAQKRVIKFSFKRTTHLYIGPPVAGVTQTQYLAKDGNDRCVVMMTVEFDGIPYSDSFAVEVRWSARRMKEKDILIDAGVFVRFTKSNMFASKIKSGTLKETPPIHLDLFEVIKSAIAAASEGGEDIKDIEDEEQEDDITAPSIETEEPAAATNTALTQIEGVLRQAVSMFLTLSPNQQLLVAFFVLYFLAKMFFGKKGAIRSEEIDDLAQKVDDLAREVKEMKALLETIVAQQLQASAAQVEADGLLGGGL